MCREKYEVGSKHGSICSLEGDIGTTVNPFHSGNILCLVFLLLDKTTHLYNALIIYDVASFVIVDDCTCRSLLLERIDVQKQELLCKDLLQLAFC